MAMGFGPWGVGHGSAWGLCLCCWVGLCSQTTLVVPICSVAVRLFPDLGSWWCCEIVSGSVGDGGDGGSRW